MTSCGSMVKVRLVARSDGPQPLTVWSEHIEAALPRIRRMRHLALRQRSFAANVAVFETYRPFEFDQLQVCIGLAR